MGSLLLEIGQCGIQIGVQLLENLMANSDSYENNFLFRNDQNVAHSILVDTEPKVLKPVLENRKKYSFLDPKNLVFQQSGRGNNWALGYFDSKKLLLRNVNKNKNKEIKKATIDSLQSSKIEKNTNISETNKNNNDDLYSSDKYMKENALLLETISEMMRKEIEKIDYYLSTFMIYSLGGGTGSGLGSRILEEIKDNYGGSYIYNAVVLPSKLGESTLQHYNCLFSFAKLQDFSDTVIYFQNDKISNYLSYALGKRSTETLVNITNINEYIVSLLTNVLKINDTGLDRFYHDIFTELTPLNEMKYLEIYAAPFQFNRQNSTGPESSWETVINNCLGQVNIEETGDAAINISKEEEKNKIASPFINKANSSQTLASYTLCRSTDIDKNLINNSMILRYLERKMKKVLCPVSWNSDAIKLDFLKEKADKVMKGKSMMVLANRTAFGEILKEINDIAYAKFKAKAYLHWYYKYGLFEDDFENCFNIIDNVIDNYSEAIY